MKSKIGLAQIRYSKKAEEINGDEFCYDGVNFSYFKSVKNLGDSLNEDILNYIGVKYKHRDFDKSNLIAIGSILEKTITNKRPWAHLYYDYIDIWGSGFIQANENKKSEYFIKNMNIHALRGSFSKQRCENILGYGLGDIPLGDPGLLISKAVPIENVRKKYDVGIIPHYIDKNSLFLKKIKLKNKRFKIIDVQGDVKKVCREVCECKFILSSAMHGLVVADSYGVPNKWIRLSDKIIGGDYKFLDYYSAFGIEKVEAIDLREREITDRDIDSFLKSYQIKKKDVEGISVGLQNSFPKKKIFNLPLNLIQNIRFAMSLIEINKNILIPIENKPIFDYLNRYFNFVVSFCKNDARVPAIEDISYDHGKPFIQLGSIKKPLVFPAQMIDYCMGKWNKQKQVSFIGIKTKTRVIALQSWINNSTRSKIEINDKEQKYVDGNILIEFSSKGRVFPEKAWDEEYYKNLLDSSFVLCPNGDFVWTYRFFEAIMCGAIPIIEDHCDLYEDFFYYDMKKPIEEYVYSSEIALKNLKLFKNRYCFDGMGQ